MTCDHYALLVTINHYPGLQDLNGPENDGRAFVEWLKDKTGGGVPKENIRHICSTDYSPTMNPDDANPTERELVRVLNTWFRVPRGWKDKVGTRIYLYFAGHGFTAGSSISDPALFTAIAQSGDPAHIAGYRYAAKIVNAGFFDEVVLIMDCCQDVLKASQVIEPTWSPPDNNQAANVKFLQAYGAPRGRKAFETDSQLGNETRGFFSSVWMEALKTATPNDEGWVTGQAVKNRFLKIWHDKYRSQTNYDPPVRLPDGEDILLYRSAEPIEEIPESFTLSNIVIPPINFDITRTEPNANLLEELPSSFKKCNLVKQSVNVSITSAEPSVKIVVVDETFSKVASGEWKLNIVLPIGCYTAFACLPGTSVGTPFSVNGAPLHLDLPLVRFKSAAPLNETSNSNEYLSKSALSVSRIKDDASSAGEGQILLFVRDVGSDRSSKLIKTYPLHIVGLSNGTKVDLQDVYHSDALGQFVWFKPTLLAGTYGLILTEEDGLQERGIVIPVIAGWRTDVYIEMRLVDDGKFLPDLETCALFLTRIENETPLFTEVGRATEIARLAIQHGQPVHLPNHVDVEKSPLIAIFAAYSAATSEPPELGSVQRCLSMLPSEVRKGLPDALVLDLFLAQATGQPIPNLSPYGLPLIPLISVGWELLVQSLASKNCDLPTIDAIGQWRISGSVWTYWLQSNKAAESYRRRMNIRFRSRVSKQETWNPEVDENRLDPDWNIDTWRSIHAGLRGLNPSLSPFQQALRRRILDALIDHEMPPNPVPSLAKAFSLTSGLALRDYHDLYISAKLRAHNENKSNTD